jgi:hypothetical protein
MGIMGHFFNCLLDSKGLLKSLSLGPGLTIFGLCYVVR